MNDKNTERFAKAREEREQLEQKLRLKHFPIDYLAKDANGKIQTAKDIFDLAWEYGHSSGESEVEIYYQDLAILVKDALLRKGF